jgi:RimJ/RimL family protein N-acetyltransferase
MPMDALIDVTDGLVRIHSRGPATSPAVIFGENETSGRISYAEERQWPATGDVRLRCDFPEQLRASGNAGRALRLLLHHLATRTRYRTAVLLVQEADADLLALVAGAGFAARESLSGGRCVLTRSVPPVRYTDGIVTIRPLRADDIDRHLEAVDDEQIDWLWLPGDRATWEAMTPAEQREHNVAYLRACEDGFGTGPKWSFSADLADASYVVYVDCDLANLHVPFGDANISYTAHPAYRSQGNVSRAVRLVLAFLREHTGAASAHFIIDEANEPSLRVARAVGAARAGRWIDEHGRAMIRHVRLLR